MDLARLQTEAYAVAVARRQWNQTSSPIWAVIKAFRHLASEVREAQAAFLEDGPVDHELADVVLCACSIAQHLGIHLDAAVEQKLEVNRARARDTGRSYDPPSRKK